ncbi:MAG: polysaccharide deacetylase family protein [Magnetococcus sp. YQC-5]
MEICQSGMPYPPYSVVISFDDGFRNNFTQAAPILDELSIPAVFYVASGMIGTERMFWVDHIEDCINLTQVDHLEIGLGTEKKRIPLESSEAKIQAVNLIKTFCKNVAITQRDDVLRELQIQSKVTPSVEHAENYQVMNWSEVVALNNHSLFTVGGHSLYHDILSQLPEKQMMNDIDLSLDLLKNYLNCQIFHYSYPEGQVQHYNNSIISFLKSRGIRCCPSAVHGTNPQGMDLFHLRRIMVGFHGVSFPFV